MAWAWVCSWWCTARTCAAGEPQAVATNVRTPRSTTPRCACRFIEATVTVWSPPFRRGGCSSDLDVFILASRYTRSPSLRIEAFFCRPRRAPLRCRVRAPSRQGKASAKAAPASLGSGAPTMSTMVTTPATMQALPMMNTAGSPGRTQLVRRPCSRAGGTRASRTSHRRSRVAAPRQGISRCIVVCHSVSKIAKAVPPRKAPPAMTATGAR